MNTVLNKCLRSIDSGSAGLYRYIRRFLGVQAVICLASGTSLVAKLPTVQLGTSDPLTSEPAGNAHFTVSRNGSTGEGLNVGYAVGGSATPGTDYRELSRTVTIPAGRSSVDVAVQVLDAQVYEGRETVKVTLVGSPGYLIGTNTTAVVGILDNEVNPALVITSPSPFQVIQRDVADEASTEIRGTCREGSGPIEATWGDTGWTVIDSIPGSTFSGQLDRQKAGQSRLRVRVRGIPDSEMSVAFVGIGNIYAVWVKVMDRVGG
jgi:hypothetical protein